MKISPQWLREFVDIKVPDRQLAEDLTLAGIAVESIKTDIAPHSPLFEMEIGTNRPDAMCHYGVARECSAIYDIALKPIKPKLPKAKATAKPFPIVIEDKGCLRFAARVIRNVKIGPSPDAILERLKIDDHHGISNAVDASNYTLMEMGKPTHAYDLDKLEGGKLIVRRARAGETVKTLDGVDRKLQPEDLIIADAVRPVGLAGVMGGLDTAISATTRNILIESAWFDPATVRKTARRLGMHTDASHIFERGADWGSSGMACDRVAELILASGGGELEGELVDAIAGNVVRYSVWLRHNEIVRHLGQDIPMTQIKRILTHLGFAVYKSVEESLLKGLPRAEVVKIKSGEMREKARAKAKEMGIELPDWHTDMEKDLIVDLPTWRLDVEREIDLIEEIARIFGYNKFANTLPSFAGGVVELPNAEKETRLRSELLALGCNEAISPTFISPGDAQVFSGAAPVMLANPLSDEQSSMRTSLVPGMLGMIAWNLNHGASDVRLFEMGHVFELVHEKSHERKMLCVGATGNAAETSVHEPARAYSFFDLKGSLESLLGAFEIGTLSFGPGAGAYYHPGRSATVSADGQVVAQLGQLHPDVAAARKLKQEIYIAEIYLDRLFALPLRAPRYQQLSKFPGVDRDFSFLFADAVTFEQIQSAVHALNIAEMRSFQPVEIFRGGGVPQGKYSVLLRARFQSEERTLRDDEVAQRSAQIIQALEAIGGSLRS
jgi:phenylalanyl-tRNA synthetase beta chain